MSILGKVANKEVFNFLKTFTVKSTYFAEKSKETLIKSQIAAFVPDFCIPYNIHAAGEYILKDELSVPVINPTTGLSEVQTYSNKQRIYNGDGSWISYREEEDPETGEIKSVPVIRYELNTDLYYDGAFDEMMYVTSLDTQQEIPFTLENFYSDYAIAAGRSASSIHSKTLAAYKLPSRYYELLCKKYPKQIDLIKAIVYRVPGDKKPDEYELSRWRRTIISEAKNFDLLAYDSSNLDDNEVTSIVDHVQGILNVIKKRWDVKEFTYEENYAAVLWSMMWCVLPLSIVAKRYANIKTPHASLNHMWDYLISKGLESYRGYLTIDQTKFLYKNIAYIHQHRGQQKVMDILIDNLLNEFGYNIKSKTIVLDTTDSLNKDTKPTSPTNQCDNCARKGVTCFRTIDNYLCNEWLGTKTLCKAEPIVLTEEFAGASKAKIIDSLISQYGYTSEQAEQKYQRAFIWRDSEIEKIKDDLNRDQLVDLSGSTESLEDILAREYTSGNEPVVNEDIIDEQRIALRSMNGTAAPTKLLEINETEYDVRFAELFNRFLTETLLRLAPVKTKNANIVKKVLCSYHFTTTNNSNEYLLDYGELLAAGYLGFVREFSTDVHVGYVELDESGEVKKSEDWPHQVLWKIDRVKEVDNPLDYKFPIPNRLRTTTSFKFAKPVLQDDLNTAWYTADETYSELLVKVTNIVDGTKIVNINRTLYAVVSKEKSSEYTGIWKSFPLIIEILGEFTRDLVGSTYSYEYFENNGEIPLIPKFFRWYYTYLNPDIEERKEEDKKIYNIIQKKISEGVYEPLEINADTDSDADSVEAIPTGEWKTTTDIYFDNTKKKFYREFLMSQFLNLDAILDGWMDIIGTIHSQETLAKYIDTMFSKLEMIYTYACSSNSTRTGLACQEFLDSVLYNGVYRFDLTGTTCKRTCTEGVPCAWYSDWFVNEKELKDSISIMDKSSSPTEVWNEFNSEVLNQLTAGCTTRYAQSSSNKIQYEKLKQLVTQLSSYRISMIDVTNSGRICNSTAQVVEDALIAEITDKDTIYFDPVGDSVNPPYIGRYFDNFETGDVYVPTNDIYRKESKQYYVLSTKTGTTEEIPTTTSGAVSTKYPVPTFEELSESIAVGDMLPFGETYEKVNLYTELDVEVGTPIKIIKNDNLWYYSIGQEVDDNFEYPGYYCDCDTVTGDSFDLNENGLNEFSTPENKLVFDSAVYRKNMKLKKYSWSTPVKSDKLKQLLQSTIVSNLMIQTSTETNGVFKMSEDSSTIETDAFKTSDDNITLK